MKKLAYQILGSIAHKIILKYRPKIVAVSGSQGKTSMIEAIYRALLPGNLRIRRSFGNYNTEWGLPASVIGAEFSGTTKDGLLKISPRGYLKVFFKGLSLLWQYDKNYPQILILEMALERPGDLTYLTKIAPPLIAVMTNVSESHLGFFGSREKLSSEKGKLIEGLVKGGVAILNIDDSSTPAYQEIARRKGAGIVTFGRGESATWRVFDLKQTFDLLTFKVVGPRGVLEITLPLLGRQFAWAAAAALAIADYFGVDLKTAGASLHSFALAKHRMNKLIVGPYLVIDDTYNASYDSFKEALWAFNQVAGKRRRVVIAGGIHELGEFAPSIHRRLGQLLAAQADFLVLIGPEAVWTKEGALSEGMPEGKIKVLTPAEAGSALKYLEPGDAILFKASRTRELDKLVDKLVQAF
jgi:UDP-N-acetylmuramoyl-tripeptide--D-alanyl-D-alanine ligase